MVNRDELTKFLSKSAVQRAVARDCPFELYGDTLQMAFRLGLLATAERETAKGIVLVALPNERSELWSNVRMHLLQVRRNRNLSVDWLHIGQKAVPIGGRRYKLVWCDGESPTVLKAAAVAVCECLESASLKQEKSPNEPFSHIVLRSELRAREADQQTTCLNACPE